MFSRDSSGISEGEGEVGECENVCDTDVVR